MIDHGAGAELRDCEETRAREEFISLLCAASGNVRRERKAGEVVARQEAFAGEIAVAVEIRLQDVLGLREEFA